MSRLYAWLDSDMSKNRCTRRANKDLSLTVNYGSRSDSKRLLDIIISYPKGSDKPKVTVTEG